MDFRDLIKKKLEQVVKSYDGNWLDGLRHGNGISYNKEGNVEYNGQWVKGLKEGKGTTFHDEGTKSTVGQWAQDYLEG